jgi:hypothetical protein
MIVQSDAVAQIKDAGCNRDLSFAPKLVATISEILRAQPCNFFLYPSAKREPRFLAYPVTVFR